MILSLIKTTFPIPLSPTGIPTCPNVRLGVPTVTKDGEPLLLEVPGPSVLFKHQLMCDTLLLHVLLLPLLRPRHPLL